MSDSNTEPLSPMERAEMMHRDIALGNHYRQEWIKHAMTLATGAIVFTVTFHEKLVPSAHQGDCKALLLFGWATLVLSLLGGLAQMRMWEVFYLSYREDHKGSAEKEAAKKLRKRLDYWLTVSRRCQQCGLVSGLGLLALYVGVTP